MMRTREIRSHTKFSGVDRRVQHEEVRTVAFFVAWHIILPRSTPFRLGLPRDKLGIPCRLLLQRFGIRPVLGRSLLEFCIQQMSGSRGRNPPLTENFFGSELSSVKLFVGSIVGT